MKGCKLFSLILLFSLVLSSFRPQKEITWTAIGDSFTYLNDHLEESQNRVEKGWITRTTELVSGLTYINKGQNYLTSVEIAYKIDDLDLKPSDVYTIFLGTNDWWLGVKTGTLDDYTNNTGIATLNGAFRVIIDKLRSLNPKAHIILMTPMQRGDFVYILNHNFSSWGSYKDQEGQSLESFVNAVKAIGKKENLEVVDLYSEPRLGIAQAVKFKYLRDPLTREYKEYTYPDYIKIPFTVGDVYPYPKEAIDVTYDGIHPSDKGGAIIAEILAKVIGNIQF
ncbi:SGNH/GDSL hydrolase family protein [[Flexibacter] sp. ATCC 35208]|uniref:SGNH/GDSL hydrolase family protein n=1 Tax=[Flexibacter] sp. ATCC 35208 TaxID=1936242 RepID=UPI0009D04087|nr:SGNH/GDSL hydrolase family protein [[Flexibacter] sp. ATCC 35208]OMP75246.1 GDSL family lipase [[Flexibacter] sp. ATCC 35208]